jgi:type II secretory pathway component GspD/PulD (secretin)
MNDFSINKKCLAILLASGTIFNGMAQEKVADAVLTGKSESAKIVKVDEILRQQYELEADILLKESMSLLTEESYEEASVKLEKVIFHLGKVSKSDPKVLAKVAKATELHSASLQGFALSLVSEAKKNQNENTQVGFEKALSLLNKAKKITGTDSKKIDLEIDKVKQLIAINEHVEKVGAYRLNDEFVNDPQKGSIANKILFDRSKILYSQRRFSACRATLEQILVNQPYNEDAVNLLYRTNTKILAAGKQRRENAYQEYLDEVEWKWSDPINIYSTESILKPDVKSIDANSQVGKIYKKLQIVIPKVRFDDRDLDFVVDFIKRTTRDLDDEGEGLNVIVSVDGGNSPAPAPAAVEDDGLGGDEFGLDEDDGAAAVAPASNGKKINLDADDIPVGEVIKYICEQVGLKYKVEEFAVIIGDSASFQTLETKFYSISAGLLEIVETKESTGDLVGGLGDDAPDEGNKFLKYFETLGISFPPGAKMKFVPNAMRLVVTNTPVNHRKLEEVLRQIGIETPQVSIESKFIEIEHTNVEEFGFEWLVGRPNHINTHPNGIDHQLIGATDTSTPTVTNPNIGGANSASGIRGINEVLSGTDIGGQAAVSLIMGDFIFQGLVRALEQESTSDTLSAPQVTAVSGKTAIIRVVDERYFPESFEAPEIGTDELVGSAPTYGEPRDIGIVLEVTPTVEPDGYTISLDLRPQVLEFLGYDTDFNSTVTTPLAQGVQDANGIDGNASTVDINYSMPLFSARTIESRVTIWDGETIMLGGLIQEKVTSITDKVPYLSDIPLLGELFKSEGSESVKTNLLIFVTARLIDPAGLPKKPSIDKGLPDFKRL